MSLEKLRKILKDPFVGIDVETTGFDWFKNDRVFGIGLYSKFGECYFDERTDDLSKIVEELVKYEGFFFAHNAKFEMHFLHKLGLDVEVLQWWCTAAIHRLLNNTLTNYKLATLGALIGYPKDDRVEKWISKNKAYTWVDIPGAKKRKKNKHFLEVPRPLIDEYCIRDAEVCYHLGIMQHERMANYNILQIELELTPVLFKMEERGLLVDGDHTANCFAREKEEAAKAERDFLEFTGKPFIDSPKSLSAVFDSLGIGYPTTKKGNPSFNKKVLKFVKHPIKDIIIRQRQAYKKAYTYFYNYMEMKDENNIIHGSFNQGGTATGRMSASNPNLQNVPKEESSTSLVRRCFVARPGYSIVSIDMDQFEYRMAINYSGEQDLIRQVHEGICIHQATANMMNVSRDVAKTVNFLLLYGGGPKALSETLGCSREQAQYYFDTYHSKLKAMSKYFNKTIEDVWKNKYVVNPFGRKCKVHRGFEYTAVNYQIQGGTADWIKKSLIECDFYLGGVDAHIVTQVHDEINFEVSDNIIAETVPKLKNIMENIALTPHVPYTAGVKVGPNLQELVEYVC